MARVIAGIYLLFWISVYSLLTLFRDLFVILRHPTTSLKKKKRDVPPSCLTDPSLGVHEMIVANGIKISYVTAGDRSKQLMLFLHGFPEFWFSWRHQLREFSKNYHVVAINMRGYGDSEKPKKISEYSVAKLGQDIVDLIPALGHNKCILVAHDWGGAIAWHVTLTHPELISKLIVLNCPHPKIFRRHLKESKKQRSMSWYMLLFQCPWLPEFTISLRDYRMFNSVFEKNTKDSNPEEVIEAYKYNFSQPGALTGPLNYYRAAVRYPTKEPQQIIELPTLLIWGDNDAALDGAMADKHTTVCSDITIKHIPNCSHWVQQDEPHLVNQHMREFL